MESNSDKMMREQRFLLESQIEEELTLLKESSYKLEKLVVIQDCMERSNTLLADLIRSADKSNIAMAKLSDLLKRILDKP